MGLDFNLRLDARQAARSTFDPGIVHDLLVVGAGPAGLNAALYAARVAEVRRQLVAMGIREDRFALKNGAAGGPGVATAEALEIQADMKGTPLPSATGQVLDPRAGTTGAMNGGTP